MIDVSRLTKVERSVIGEALNTYTATVARGEALPHIPFRPDEKSWRLFVLRELLDALAAR